MVKQELAPTLFDLFIRMQPSEQAHSISIAGKLDHKDKYYNDLFTAALLHDVGKSLYPLSIWERVTIVLGKFLFPNRVNNWGQGQPKGWKRPFVVSENHAEWGAEMVSKAGASPLTAALIKKHSQPIQIASVNYNDSPELNDTDSHNLEDQLLQRLQLLDEEL